MSVGIVGGWMFVILGLSYYVRGRIGPQRWRKLHRFTALAWVLGVVHALMMGTDAGAAWFLLAAALVVLPAGALLVRRLDPGPACRGMRFDCFGSRCGVWADAGGRRDARRCLENWHLRFSRFRPDERALAPQRRPARGRARQHDDGAPARGRARGRGGHRRPRRRHAARRDRGRRLRRRPRARRCRSTLALRARPAAPPRRAEPALAAGARSAVDGWEVTRPPGLALRQRRARQGPVRRPDRRAARAAASFAVDCGGDLRFARPARAGSRSPTRSAAGRCTSSSSRDGAAADERDRPAQLARRRRPPGAPPARPRDRRGPRSPASSRRPRSRPPRVEAEWRAKAAVLSGPERAATGSTHGGVRRARRRHPLRRSPTHEPISEEERHDDEQASASGASPSSPAPPRSRAEPSPAAAPTPPPPATAAAPQQPAERPAAAGRRRWTSPRWPRRSASRTAEAAGRDAEEPAAAGPAAPAVRR